MPVTDFDYFSSKLNENVSVLSNIGKIEIFVEVFMKFMAMSGAFLSQF